MEVLAFVDQMGNITIPLGGGGVVAAKTHSPGKKKPPGRLSTKATKSAEPGGFPAQVSAVREAMALRQTTDSLTTASPRAPAATNGWTALLRLSEGAPADRIALVRSGVRAEDVPALIEALNLPAPSVLEALQIARTSLARRIAQRSVLAPDESERVVGLVTLIGQVSRMLQDSGVPESKAVSQGATWLGAWMAAPNNALGGERPLAYLDTAEGRGLVSRVLGAMEAGTYW